MCCSACIAVRCCGARATVAARQTYAKCNCTLLLIYCSGQHEETALLLQVLWESSCCRDCCNCSAVLSSGHTFCKSARETSNTRPLSPSEAICKSKRSGVDKAAPKVRGLLRSCRQSQVNTIRLDADLGTLCPGHQCLADVADGKHGGGLHIIPVLL